MSKGGFTFGDTQLYQLRKYYRGWIERTLWAAHNIMLPISKPVVLRFKDCIDPIAIEDEGRLPCSILQRKEKISYYELEIACLFVEIRNMIQVWWKCNKETPGDVEQWLIHLDHVIETWDRQEVTGNVKIGYTLKEVK